MEEIRVQILDEYVGSGRIVIDKVATGIAIIIWDPLKKRASATHFYSARAEDVKSKIKRLVELIDGDMRYVRVKFAGGSDLPGMNIGKRFILELAQAIKELRLQVGGYDVGGNFTRQITFNPMNGECRIRYITGGEKII